MWVWGWRTWCAVLRVFSQPPGLVGGFDVSTARGIGTGRRRGVDPTLVVGLEDTFTRGARVREIPSVEPAITERFILAGLCSDVMVGAVLEVSRACLVGG